MPSVWRAESPGRGSCLIFPYYYAGDRHKCVDEFVYYPVSQPLGAMGHSAAGAAGSNCWAGRLPHNMTHSGGAPLNAMATVRLGHTTTGVGTAARDPLGRAGRTRDCGITAMPLPARIKARADYKESTKMSCHGCKRSLAKTSRTALP